ncbi:MAG: efflux RND transporter periplasmic adaptor subunit [Mariprofundaceae bacterium]|nr:efflux RND transporter periplasmic adaptor subunit [Mariprofundaceae bacterium]
MIWRVALIMLISLISACGNEKTDVPVTIRTVNITTRTVELRDVQIMESAVGRILNPRSVTVSAEVPATVAWIGVDVGSLVNKSDVLVRLVSNDFKEQATAAKAEIASLEARIPAQRRLVQRYRKLAADQFVSPTMLDQSEAKLATLIQSKRASAAEYARAQLNVAHTIVRAPISGQVQQRFVAAGNYVKAGTRLVDIVAGGRLTISLPFPETKTSVIRVGQNVRLILPSGGQVLYAVIRDLSPMIGQSSGAFEARLEVKNPGGWRPGGSVFADVQVAEHKQAVVVPDSSVVLRPRGEVVYVISNGKASERSVRSGVHTDGSVEIVQGLKTGEIVAMDGASFLSNGAAVHVIHAENKTSE